MDNIIINKASEGVLKDITIEIPRNKLVVITGLSGSGKSTLAVDVLFQECQRQYLEAMGLAGINKPKVESVKNVSPAIIISQTEANKNPRSTIGTLTNIYTDLRMIYEKLGKRICPDCGKLISNADCKEELEKSNGDFTVFMYCNHCNHKMLKITRSHLSFNTREGACPTCHGLGKVLTLNEANVINEALSLEDGAVSYWGQGAYLDYNIGIVYKAFNYYQVPIKPNIPVSEFSELQKEILFNGAESEKIKSAFPNIKLPKTVSGGKFEGIFKALWRRLSDSGGDAKQLDEYFDYNVCLDCNGERLNAKSRAVIVNDIRLPEIMFFSLDELFIWLKTLKESISKRELNLVEAYILDLETKIKRIINVGLGYLSINRQSITLSGGETQRLRLAATLDSDLTGVIYIMDEPTIGLHPQDTLGMIKVLKGLRDLGNTVVVIEHDPDVMNEADYIIDIGPGSGKHGGEVIGKGTLFEILNQDASVTGQYLKRKQTIKDNVRKGSDKVIKIKNANLHNLKNVNIDFPTSCLNVITGVSGSGKSTLIFDVLANFNSKKIDANISGLDEFNQVITIEQAPITKMKRSNVATYTEIYTEIRKLFAAIPEAKEKGFTNKHFSFNTPGGRCENCEGLGYVESNMLFFKNTDIICPVCLGKQFNEEVLAIKFNDYSIKEILQLSIEEALIEFDKYPKIKKILSLLLDVGLGYLELGQSLTTLSGGECQRLKLAKELINSFGKNNLYLMDEPTTGLHPVDVDNFLMLLNRMVDLGNTVIVVEHNQQVINNADWITDLGPEGGVNGGKIVFSGTPKQMIETSKSATAIALKESLKTISS